MDIINDLQKFVGKPFGKLKTHLSEKEYYETEYGDIIKNKEAYCIFNNDIDVRYEWIQTGNDSYVSGNILSIEEN
jgi:hypothetical protein